MDQSAQVTDRIPQSPNALQPDLSMMSRRFFPAMFACLVSAVPALAQATADRVYYRDKAQDGKVVSLDGEAKETVSNVQVLGPDKKIKGTISAADMIRIDYGTVPGVERNGQLAAIAQEGGTDALKAVAAFRDLMKFPGATGNPKAKRYLEFRELVWSAKIVDAKAGDDFKTEGKLLANRLVVFSKANAANWESWITARLAARYLCELEDVPAAADAMSILGKNMALAAELRYEAKLVEAGYLFRANKRLDAESILKELAADQAFPATGGLRERLGIFEEIVKAPLPPPERKEGDPPATPEETEARTGPVKAAAVKIEALIAKAKDPTARGAGYSALGEIYLRHGLLRDAMWAYLWVDVVYNQDRDEQVKAVNRLVQIFGVLKEKDKGEGEKDRAETYRERLPKIRG